MFSPYAVPFNLHIAPLVMSDAMLAIVVMLVDE
jgi:hypothetical protein